MAQDAGQKIRYANRNLRLVITGVISCIHDCYCKSETNQHISKRKETKLKILTSCAWTFYVRNQLVMLWDVQNPYVQGGDPCGSSSGSAISVAANMVAVSLGTETDGSILCPADSNSVVGFKPTVGLTSRAGVIPVSPRQDTIGYLLSRFHVLLNDITLYHL